MAVGKCALCLETRELRKSHFLPAGFYRIMREGAPTENPVLVNKTSAFMSSAQVKAYLLCGECEQRFNQAGEDWVLKNCWRSATEFHLHSRLMGATPLVDEEGFRSYEGAKIPGIAIDKVCVLRPKHFLARGRPQLDRRQREGPAPLARAIPGETPPLPARRDRHPGRDRAARYVKHRARQHAQPGLGDAVALRAETAVPQ